MKGFFAAVVALAVASGLVGVSWVAAQIPEGEKAPKPEPLAPFPAGYLDHGGLSRALEGLARDHPAAVRVRSMARSRGGRDVWMVEVGHEGAKDAPARPSVLIVANLEADHLVGSEVALGLISRLAEADGKDPAVTKWLDERKVYVVPRLNPDGAELVLKGKPAADLRGNLAPIDRDRDGKANEDGPDDIDGDGLALTMRVRDPARATLVVDVDPRLLRKANPALGEVAAFAELTEGIDNDGDGEINEDPPGGVNLNRTWPQNWTEFQPEAGTAPGGEPEVNPLIRFAFAHPEIVAVWSYGLNDNTRTAPGGTNAADSPYLAELVRLFNASAAPAAATADPAAPKAGVTKDSEEIAKSLAAVAKADPPAEKDEPAKEAAPPKAKAQAKAKGQGGRGGRAGATAATVASPAAASPGMAGTTDGAMSEWAYQQFGTIGFAFRLWDRPEASAGAAALAGEGDARWLDWNDKVVGGSAFVPYHEVDHPKFGKVQVGGWKPGVRLNPPAPAIGPIVDRQFAFLKDLLGRMPALAIRDAVAEAKGAGVYEIKAVVENPGYLPTALAQGVVTRKAQPVLVKFGAGDARILSGRPINRVDALAGSGGRSEFRWLVLAPEGAKSVSLEASCPKAGTARVEIALPKPN